MSDEKDYSFVIEGKLALPYQYFAGSNGSHFITTLRDEKKILGSRSEKAGLTYVPPRSVCDRTFEDLSEAWVEVGNEGVVTGFTVIRYAEPYQPRPVPFVLGLVKLDGSDTPIAHVVDCAPDAARVGMRVRAEFAEVPTNNILEITGFSPLD